MIISAYFQETYIFSKYYDIKELISDYLELVKKIIYNSFPHLIAEQYDWVISPDHKNMNNSWKNKKIFLNWRMIDV